jgi:acetyl-CoA synthetase
MNRSSEFLAARDCLLALRTDYRAAVEQFNWPELDNFNWANDYFDTLVGNSFPALRVVTDIGAGDTVTFATLAERSRQVAHFLSELGVKKGDRILVMLGNVVPLWETTLGAMRLGAVIIPATTLLTRNDVADRLERGGVRAIVADGACCSSFAGLGSALVRIAVGADVAGWTKYELSKQAPAKPVYSLTRADDPLLIYFTSGTTARAKLVVHTHASYPVGHLTTMYWIGIQRGDVHLNLSSPGWAKHAWSSVFAPWNAAATVLAYDYQRFSAPALLDKIVECRVTTFCAPPTVWRMLVQEDLRRWPVAVRELASAGEPLNPEVIERVRAAWGLTIRDGFGQTETTAQIGNSPGQVLKLGSMGRALPGYRVTLLDADGNASNEGEICLELRDRPMGLMQEYLSDDDRTNAALRNGYYHTGDVARRDTDGYFNYVGRLDDVFKSSDYRVSPFELESALIEHPAVAEAAVVPSPDTIRLAVPKAYVALARGYEPNAIVARSIFMHMRARVAPFMRIRRLEFTALPKTISGKIRRVELRAAELARVPGARNVNEFWEDDRDNPDGVGSG